MKYRIHHGPTDDYIDIEEDTIEEVRAEADFERRIRGWKEEECWSERIKD